VILDGVFTDGNIMKTINDYLDEFEECEWAKEEKALLAIGKFWKQRMTELVDNIPVSRIGIYHPTEHRSVYTSLEQFIKQWKEDVKK